VAFGAALLAYAAQRLGLGATAAVRGLLFYLPALCILYSIWFLLATLTIWFVKIYNITFVLKNVLEAGRFPVHAYPGRLRMVLTFVVPVAFLTTVPARAMIGRGGPALFGVSAVLALALLLATRAFWRFALRFYTSASS
jgi:ABC-2 type transport system permease protein